MHSTSGQPTLFIRATLVLHLLALIVLIIIPVQWRWVLALILANHLLITINGLWPRSQWLGTNLTRLPAHSIARNEVALTIDDGPDPDVTPQVLNLLDRHAVRATFFCVGERAARYPALCQDIIRRGHAVENHSQHHLLYFALLGPRGFRRELHSAQTTLTLATGLAPTFFRAPAGLRNPFLEPVLKRLGLQLVSWSVRGFDTKIRNVERVKQKLQKGLRAGAILLLHDGNSARTPQGVPVILEVLPAIIELAARSQLRFVTLTEALSHVNK